MPLILNELGTLLKMYAHTHTYLPTYIHTYIHTFAYIPKHTGMRAAARWSNIWISTSTRTHKTKPNQVKKWVKIFNNSYEKIRRKRSPPPPLWPVERANGLRKHSAQISDAFYAMHVLNIMLFLLFSVSPSISRFVRMFLSFFEISTSSINFHLWDMVSHVKCKARKISLHQNGRVMKPALEPNYSHWTKQRYVL